MELQHCLRYYEAISLQGNGGHFDNAFTRVIYTSSWLVFKRIRPNATHHSFILWEDGSSNNVAANYSVDVVNATTQGVAGLISNRNASGRAPTPLRFSITIIGDAEL